MGVSHPEKLVIFLALVTLCITVREGSSKKVFRFKKKEPMVIVAQYKQKVEIDCSTTEANASTTLYRRKGTRLRSGYLKIPVRVKPRNGGVYTLKNISSRDVGFYGCEATSPEGNKIAWSKRSGRLFVLGLPDCSRSKTVDGGNVVVFKCSGPKGTIIKWRNIPNHAITRTTTRREWTKSFLKLKHVKQGDNHRSFTCSTTFRGVIRRFHFKIIIANPIPCAPVLNRNVRKVFHPLFSQNVEMTCEVERCMFPPPKIEWEMQWWPCSLYRGYEHCVPKSDEWKKKVNGKIRTSGFKSTLKVDKFMQLAFFKCTAKNAMGEQSITYKLIRRQRRFTHGFFHGNRKKR